MFFGCRKTNPKVRFWGVRIGARPIWPSLLGKTLIFRKKLQFFWERKKNLSLLPGREREIPSCLFGVFPTDISTFLFPLFSTSGGEKESRERSVNFPLERFFYCLRSFPSYRSTAEAFRKRHGFANIRETFSIFANTTSNSALKTRRGGRGKSLLFLHSTRSFCHVYGKRRRGENYPPFFDLSIFFLGPPTPPFPHITAGKSNAPYVIMWTLYRRTTGRLIILSAATRRVPENFFAYFFSFFLRKPRPAAKAHLTFAEKEEKALIKRCLLFKKRSVPKVAEIFCHRCPDNSRGCCGGHTMILARRSTTTYDHEIIYKGEREGGGIPRRNSRAMILISTPRTTVYIR